MALLIISWSFGGNGLPWIVSSEIFPGRVRSITGAFAAASQWLVSFAATQAFPYMRASAMGGKSRMHMRLAGTVTDV
jgi:hypothetical protein